MTSRAGEGIIVKEKEVCRREFREGPVTESSASSACDDHASDSANRVGLALNNASIKPRCVHGAKKGRMRDQMKRLVVLDPELGGLARRKREE